MPARNLFLLLLTAVACVASWYARERDRRGRRVDEVLALIDTAYIEPVDGDALVAAAVDGAVATLDENSAWLRGDGQRELEAALDQRFGGVGLELSIDERTGTLTVATPMPGGPAARAGILAGDRVVAIDGETTAGMALRDAVARLRGDPGAAVTLSVAAADGSRADGAAARDVRLVRELVQVESVEGDRRLPDGTWDWWLEGEPGVAFVRITGFGERTAGELEAALARVAAGQFGDSGPPTPLRGLVIDLRGNPGGLVTAAVDVCDLFLDEGVIVSTRGRRTAAPDGGTAAAAEDVRRATAGVAAAGVPIAVLVDGLTASAAEIVAACLQDHGRARVVGSRTYGKGTVQSILPLAGGGLLKLTTAEYLRPDGTSIDRRHDAEADDDWGVTPDDGLALAPSNAALERLAGWRRRRDSPLRAGDAAATPRAVDEVLARALDSLTAESAPPADLGGEKEAPGDAHDAAAAGA